MNRYLKFLFVTLLIVASKSVFSLGFGQITLHSYLNEPLDAEIDLIGIEGVDLNNTVAALAPTKDFEKIKLGRPFFLTKLKFQIMKQEGRAFILVTSTEPVQQPFLDFLVVLNWPEGRLVRGYTLLFDPAPLNAKAKRVKPMVNEIEESAPEEKPESEELPLQPEEVSESSNADGIETSVMLPQSSGVPQQQGAPGTVANEADVSKIREQLGTELFMEIMEDAQKNNGQNLESILKKHGKSIEDLKSILPSAPVPKTSGNPRIPEPLPPSAPSPQSFNQVIERPKSVASSSSRVVPEVLENLFEPEPEVVKHPTPEPIELQKKQMIKTLETYIRQKEASAPVIEKPTPVITPTPPTLYSWLQQYQYPIIALIATLGVILFGWRRRSKKPLTLGELITKKKEQVKKEEETVDEEFEVRMDLARQYVQIQDIKAAEEVLKDVIDHGSQREQTSAKKLLEESSS